MNEDSGRGDIDAVGRAVDWALLAVIIGTVVAVNVLAHFAGHWAGLVAVPVGALAAAVVAHLRGLSLSEMGISSSELKYGFRWSAIAVVAVIIVVAAGVLIPWTRQFFLNDRYASGRDALLAAFVWIPLQTVLPEELLFRGVLQGALRRVFSRPVTLLVGAGLFGLWHIASSLGLAAGNAGVTGTIGSGVGAAVAGIAGAVVATAAAGWILGWLRFRTGNLLAPIVLHWSLNAVGALGAALAWSLL